jgi:hypothetical protein
MTSGYQVTTKCACYGTGAYKPYFQDQIPCSRLDLRKSMHFRKHMLLKQLLQSAKLLQVLKQKPTGPPLTA